MLRPERGEGERPNKAKSIAKGPLLFAVALFAATPICMAEVAFATSLTGQQAQGSSFLKPLQPYERLQGSLGFQPQTTSTTLLKSLPKTNLGSRLLPFATPSLEDLNTLESTLSKLQSQLNTLKGLEPKVKPERITSLENQIQNLKTIILATKEARLDYIKAQEALKDAIKAQTNAQTAYDTSVTLKTDQETLLTFKKENLQDVEDIKTGKQISLDAFVVLANDAKAKADNAAAAMTAQEQVKAEAQASLSTSQEQYSTAAANLEAAQQTLNEASSELTEAGTQLDASAQALATAQQNLTTAQDDYDNSLIPDPNWTAPTYQKEHIRTIINTRTVEVKTLVPNTTTTLQEQVIPNILFNSDFASGTSGWSGVNAGWQGSSPSLVNGEVTFSYQNQTVSQGLFSGPFQNATLTLSADWLNNDTNRGITDNYSMTVEAKDINQNPVGSATYTSTGSHEWENKSVSLVATGPVSYITVSFSGIDNGFWYGTYGPHFKNPTLQISHGQMVTETTYEEVITYEEETYYTYETYYTTELVKTEGTLNVKINEGGQATFNAPAGAVFVSSNLRYEAIARPTCGKDIAPQLTGLSTITIQALNSVWGDPCGGWQKHVTGTLTYLGQPTAPLIRDPALLEILNEAEAEHDVALQVWNSTEQTYNAKVLTKDTASADLASSQTTLNEAEAAKSVAQSQLNVETAELARLTTLNEEAQTKLVEATQVEATASQQKVEAVTKVEATSLEVSAATEELATTTEEAVATEASLNQTTLKVAEAQKVNDDKTETLVTTYKTAITKTEVVTEDVKTAPTDLIPEPPVEEGSKEIPAELTAENLMDVNLEAVDPTELTEAQAEQLVEAAMETFETAEQGSEEYEQALDALYLAAEQDDIVLDPALAAIPGLAAATELVNFFGNAGADMSPKVREESEKVVVTAVVAAGAAIQSAAAAASTASAPSGGSRRIGK
jgi:hypothetical protein